MADARGVGHCHVLAPAMARCRRVARGRNAAIRDPPHGGCASSDARPGRGFMVASFLRAALESWGGIWDAPTGRGGGDPGSPGHPGHANPPPQRGAPEQGAYPCPNLVALHPMVPCFSGPGAGGGFPACSSSVRRLRPPGPQPGLLGPRHAIRGAPRDGPRAGGGGPQLRPRLPAAGAAVRPGVPSEPTTSGGGP